LEISRIIRRDDYLATILNRIAAVYKAIGKLEIARDFFRQAAEKYHELGDEKKAKANLYEADNC
jgi:DNA-binding FrmR family transcriptional regulator